MLALPAEAEPAAPAPRVSLGPISLARLSLLAKAATGDRATRALSGNLHTGAKLRQRGRIMLNNMQINVASHKDLICVSRQLLKMLF